MYPFNNFFSRKSILELDKDYNNTLKHKYPQVKACQNTLQKTQQ